MTPGRRRPKSPLRPDGSSDKGRPPIARAWHALHPESPLRGRARAILAPLRHCMDAPASVQSPCGWVRPRWRG
jgi:hypothetical protein